MYKLVIVPLDGSEVAERALRPAEAIAQQTGAELVPMIVAVETHYDQCRSYLADACADLAVPIRNPYVLPASDPVACIANAGEEEESLIVMSSHGNTGVRRAVFGSVAEGVIRTLERPVMVLGPGFAGGFEPRGGRMMVPLDGSTEAASILPAVTAWCQAFGTEAWPVSVLDRPAGDPPDADTSESAYVRGVAGDLDDVGLETGWEVMSDADPARALATFSSGLPAGVVAMTTHGRGGLRRAMAGSVAARLVHDVECPVLILRPESADPAEE